MVEMNSKAISEVKSVAFADSLNTTSEEQGGIQDASLSDLYTWVDGTAIHRKRNTGKEPNIRKKNTNSVSDMQVGTIHVEMTVREMVLSSEKATLGE